MPREPGPAGNCADLERPQSGIADLRLLSARKKFCQAHARMDDKSRQNASESDVVDLPRSNKKGSEISLEIGGADIEDLPIAVSFTLNARD